MLTILRRYVLPGWNGSVAFSLNPVALGSVLEGRYAPLCVK